MKRSSPVIDRRVAIAVLAAGQATRFGGGKLDAGLAGRAVGQWVTDTAEQAGFMTRFVVAGPARPKFVTALSDWDVVTNPSPENGIASSIRAAAKAAGSCDRLVIILADMPLISGDHLRALALGSRVIFTLYPDSSHGVPAAFPARCFARLAEMTGERGAAMLDWGEEIETLAPASVTALRDIDTHNDLKTLRQETSA